GSILRQNNLEQRRFISTEVFVFVDKEYVSEDLITIVPANTYLCIYCNKFEKEKEYAARLMNAIEEKGYAVCGDYLCEAIADLPAINDNERGMFLRLQVPIKFC
ncbi:MAG: MerR family transcriptional regulator, partial [Oscillospiraceae bacterium]